MRHPRIPIAPMLLASLAICSCVAEEETAAPESGIQPGFLTAKTTKNQTMAKVRSLESDAPRSVVQTQIPEIFAEIRKAKQSDKPMVYEAISQLSEHPNAVDAIQSHYATLPAKAFRDRQFALAIVGQMRSEKNLEFLKEIVWAPLPAIVARVDQADGLSERQQEEIVRSKAIHGIGYLRTTEAFSVLKEIMKEHESKYLRTIAIDTYLWNHDDDPQASKELSTILQEPFQEYVGVPRFVRGTSHVEFQRQIGERKERSTESKEGGE